MFQFTTHFNSASAKNISLATAINTKAILAQHSVYHKPLDLPQNIRMDSLAWLISTDMGYGHQRAIYPLLHIGKKTILDAAKNSRITKEERLVWKKTQSLYELFSRAGNLPLIGKPFSRMLDRILYIPQLYPYRDLSKATFQVKFLRNSIQKGLCRGVLSQISEEHLPVVTSFYAPAIAADMQGENKVFCIICDTDLNRVWVAEDPWESRIEYFAPTGRVAQRLVSYGVSPERVHITGFPLPISLTGDADLFTLRKNLSIRLKILDPKGRFHALHKKSVEHFIGNADSPIPANRKFTLTYAVGGAGAQKEIAAKILKSLLPVIHTGDVRINLSAGTRHEIKEYFESLKQSLCPKTDFVSIIYGKTNSEYFNLFNTALADTDVLWTKPSELSFYCGLGLPIVLTPAIGPQEWFNRKWLREIGAGFKQYKPEYSHQWLFDLLNKGRLAEMAWSGFLKARKCGTFKIEEMLRNGRITTNDNPLQR